ncbi:hypothetical protein F3Y22_tig00110017pilonHSYRG00057 [Hibiscus syriacus]|uniref:DUF4283 domain-containing protein n=1 Tax=Hibiscus syriacus TaxID=106335 RepID=A0A6A3BT26_HIBSY|nr:hypothetical protein F3Y22_tig00110017pilonHSYRG00057 [Hibiscus syriacus]
MDLENDYFLTRFQIDTDYEKVLAEGPWIIYVQYLTVQPWSRNFNTSHSYPTTFMAWIHLPGFPEFMFNSKIIFRIGMLIGRVMVGDKIQGLEYGNLPLVYFSYGSIQHMGPSLPRNKQRGNGEAVSVSLATSMNLTTTHMHHETTQNMSKVNESAQRAPTQNVTFKFVPDPSTKNISAPIPSLTTPSHLPYSNSVNTIGLNGEHFKDGPQTHSSIGPNNQESRRKNNIPRNCATPYVIRNKGLKYKTRNNNRMMVKGAMEAVASLIQEQDFVNQRSGGIKFPKVFSEYMHDYRPDTFSIRQAFPYLSDSVISRLDAIVTSEEIRQVLFDINPLKAPRPDDDLLILFQAITNQANLVRATLDQFSRLSGHKVNSSKTIIFFSSNVNEAKAANICVTLGFQRLPNLGKYLGMPLFHSRVTKNIFQFIIKKVRGKLSNWTTWSLSLAGRVTLAKSIHLGGTNESNKPTLVKWDDCCHANNHGGLGIRPLNHQNEAFLIKLGYTFLMNTNTLWSKIFAWDRGFRRIEVETDNKEATCILSSPASSFEPTLMRRVRYLLHRHWTVKTKHIIWDANSSANAITHLGCRASTERIDFADPPANIHRLLHLDMDKWRRRNLCY